MHKFPSFFKFIKGIGMKNGTRVMIFIGSYALLMHAHSMATDVKIDVKNQESVKKDALPSNSSVNKIKQDRKKIDGNEKCNVAQTQPVEKSDQKKELFLIDEIEVSIFGQEGVKIITSSDVSRPSLTGSPRSKEDIVFEQAILLDAQKYKISADDDAIDKYLNSIQREHNLSRSELEMIFTAAGWTLEEGREQLKNLQVINMMLDFKIRGNLIVLRKDVENYYHEHPEYNEPAYLLSTTLVPYTDSGNKEKQKKTLMQEIQNKSAAFDWSEPFWINSSDIAEDKQFITSMLVATISKPIATEHGFELYRLVDKKEAELRSLEDRYTEILNELRRPKYEELLRDYKQELYNLDNVSIVYTNLQSNSH
jgi:hypothetical protein